MSIKIDPSGMRFVQSEAVVPGTPEEVWQAIATGPGVSSWFVPCQIEERVGGKVVASFGPGMDSTSTITSWNPPHSFSAEGSEIAPGSPAMATEWIVEAQDGGNCLVRVEHSWFAETDEWDSQFEGTESGWPAFFRDLALVLAHFKGQPSATIQLMAMSIESEDATWDKLASGLGLKGAELGASVQSPQGAPPLAGQVKHVDQGDHRENLVLLDSPTPGIAHFFGMSMAGMACVSVRLFFYGQGANETAAAQEPVWSAWLEQSFPMPAFPEQ